MNFISHDNAYSLYPKMTFEKRSSLLFDPGGARREAARQKYVARGWTMTTEATAEEQLDVRSTLKGGSRWVGDSRCWKVPLSCENVHLTPCVPPRQNFRVCDHLALHSWQLRHIPFPIIAFKIIESPILKWRYTVGSMMVIEYLFPWIKKSSNLLGREGHNLSKDGISYVISFFLMSIYSLTLDLATMQFFLNWRCQSDSRKRIRLKESKRT
jgi:hypothetical protein